MKKTGELAVRAEMRKEDSEVQGRGHKELEFPADVDTRAVGCVCGRKDEVVNCRWFLPCHKNTKYCKKKKKV